MINPGNNYLPGMLLFLDFRKIVVGVGVLSVPENQKNGSILFGTGDPSPTAVD